MGTGGAGTVVGSLSDLVLVALVRVGGKRMLAQMNAFDLIITMAMGACFGRGRLGTATVPRTGLQGASVAERQRHVGAGGEPAGRRITRRRRLTAG